MTILKTLTPSASRICDAAAGHFAEHGYDASSLSEIAAQAGMRKASLYAHFANKDALYLQTFQRALAEEGAYVEAGLRLEAAEAVPAGHWHPLHLAERYATSANLRFILRAAFMPPAGIRPAITRGFEHYLEQIRQGFCQALCKHYAWARDDGTRLELYGDAYLGIIDSLHVELMYASPDVYARRAASLLKILDDSLQATQQA
ncbi:TetR/AcrR family transcriptional regulator [Pseudomonas sp. X10]